MSTSTDQKHTLISRREAILRVSAMFGGAALVGQASMLSGCSPEDANRAPFTASDIALLDEIAETILPETDTPGAKAAEVGAFMALMVTDTYYKRDQKTFRKGLDRLNARCAETFGRDFVSAEPFERLSLLESLDAEQFEYMQNKSANAPAHYFRMMKELALLGYFTSEIGYTKAMRYVETPGRFDPCSPYSPGEKTWAEHA